MTKELTNMKCCGMKLRGLFMAVILTVISLTSPAMADVLPNGDVVATNYKTITLADDATNLANAANTTASSSYYYNSGTVSSLFDEDATTHNGVLQSSPYLQIDLSEESVTSVVIKMTPVDLSNNSQWVFKASAYGKTYYGNWFPITFSIQGSVDGSTWTTITSCNTGTLCDGTSRTATSTEAYYTDAISLGDYKYLKIKVSKGWGANDWKTDKFSLGEFAIYEADDVAVTKTFALTKLGASEPQFFTSLLSSSSTDTSSDVYICTNAPQKVDYRDETTDDVAIDKLVDGDVSTFFHSTWYVGAVSSDTYKAAPQEKHYIQVDFGAESPRDNFALYMVPRTVTGKPNLMPAKYRIYATNDENAAYSSTSDKTLNTETGWESSWTEVAKLQDTRGNEYFSGTLWLNTKYRFVRLVNEESYPENEYVQCLYSYSSSSWMGEVSSSSKIYQPYFCLSELQICVPQNVELVSDDNGYVYEVLTASDGTKTATYTQKLPASSTTTSVTIPDVITVGDESVTVSTISNTAFTGNTALTSVTIGKNIESIGTGTFMNTPELTSITVSSDNSTYSSVDDALLETSSILYNGQTLLVYPEARINTSFVLPDDIVAIDQFAFYEAKYLETIDLSQTTDENGAEEAATGNLKTIAACAFENAKALTTITIPKTVETIGISAFENCPKLTSAYVYGQTIGDYSFRNNAALTTLDFYYDNGIGDDNTSYDAKYMAAHSTTTSIGKQAFMGCTALSGTVDIPRSVTSIGARAFNSCSSVTTLINHCTESSVADYCYNGMTNLATIYLYGANTEAINQNAFTDCTSLKDVYIYSKKVPTVTTPNAAYLAANIHCFADLVDTYTSNTSYTGTTSALTLEKTIGHAQSVEGKSYTTASPYSSAVFEWPVKLDDSVTPYYATGATTEEEGATLLTITELTIGDDHILPANTPVIFKVAEGSEGTNFTMPLYSSAAASSTDDFTNDSTATALKGDAVEHYTSTGDGLIYGMTYASDGTAVFRRVKSGVVCPYGKIYITAEAMGLSSDTQANKMVIIGEGSTTSITEVLDYEAKGQANGQSTEPLIYDLQGRRVATPTHGIYIINGKKSVVK